MESNLACSNKKKKKKKFFNSRLSEMIWINYHAVSFMKQISILCATCKIYSRYGNS